MIALALMLLAGQSLAAPKGKQDVFDCLVANSILSFVLREEEERGTEIPEEIAQSVRRAAVRLGMLSIMLNDGNPIKDELQIAGLHKLADYEDQKLKIGPLKAFSELYQEAVPCWQRLKDRTAGFPEVKTN